MLKVFIILFFSSMLIANNKIDINNCKMSDLERIPLDKTKIDLLWNFLSSNRIDSIYDLMDIEGFDIEDIHIMKQYIEINNKIVDSGLSMSYKVDQWLADEGSSEGMSEIWLDRYFSPININLMNYDQLSSLPNLSPMDVVAVLKQKKRGEIKGTFQLKNSPGISHYGYKNLRDFASFDSPREKLNVRFNTFFRSSPSNNGFDEDDAPIQYDNSNNPESLYKLQVQYFLNGFDINVGHLRYNQFGDFKDVYTNKAFVSMELSDKDYGLNLIAGNYNVSYGQGLIFETGDSYQPRRTGHKFTKRISGIYSDLTRSQQYVLNGAAFQFSNEYFRLSVFGSKDKRDAIINQDGSFTALITMAPRMGWGWYNDPNNSDWVYQKIHDNILDAVTEVTYGGNIRVSPFLGTHFGFTFYESLYDRVLDPQIIESVVGGVDDSEPEFNQLTDYDEYSGDAFYLNYSQSNSCDPEIAAMYASSGTSDNWSSAQSFRRIHGFEFSTVYKNASFQFEYGEMNTDISKLGKFNHNNPSAFVFNAYFQFANFDFIIVHRDYDLDYDNPYQRSYSAYRRYKSSIFEDVYWLEDPMYYHLYGSASQPQAEKGTYIESRYQFNEKFVAGLQWDSWVRKADNAKYFRIVSKLEWRPLFNYRVYFRYKIQSRGSFDLHHPSPYFTKEARIRFKLRLSNYDNIELLYSWNYTTFSPRPRLAGSANAFIHNMDVGDIGTPDQSIGFAFEHNYSKQLSMRAGVVYASGFLWYIEDTDFRLFNTDSEIFHSWISFKYKPMPLLSFNFKVSHSSDFPMTTIVNGINTSGQNVEDPFIHEQQFNYRIQIDYAI
tara:strand:- start:6 stop:2492 length:2487 start_codon:yes stop_codon:yes gene_type:complete